MRQNLKRWTGSEIGPTSMMSYLLLDLDMSKQFDISPFLKPVVSEPFCSESWHQPQEHWIGREMWMGCPL